MALSFTHPGAEPVPTWTAPCRLYLTADDRVVGEGDTDALSLLVAPGHIIPLAHAIRYGLVAPTQPEADGEAAEPAQTEPVSEPALTEQPDGDEQIADAPQVDGAQADGPAEAEQAPASDEAEHAALADSFRPAPEA